VAEKLDQRVKEHDEVLKRMLKMPPKPHKPDPARQGAVKPKKQSKARGTKD
jgi:hypothetical protein